MEEIVSEEIVSVVVSEEGAKRKLFKGIPSGALGESIIKRRIRNITKRSVRGMVIMTQESKRMMMRGQE